MWWVTAKVTFACVRTDRTRYGGEPSKAYSTSTNGKERSKGRDGLEGDGMIAHPHSVLVIQLSDS
jgi:hypothetical protein